MASGGKAVNFVAEKILRIPVADGKEPYEERVTRGESIATANDADAYIDREPSVRDFIKEITPTRHDVATYLKSLFPFVEWLPRYNGTWLLGDAVAGITVGCVVVPQSTYEQLIQ